MFFIATPSWKYGRFIGDSVESVRAQSDGGFVRHHVQDAVSPDDTAEQLAARAWSGLSVKQERDRGQCDALNRAFSQVPDEVEYLGWLNADEFYLPGALARVRDTFERSPDIDIVYGDTLHVDESGALLRLVAQHDFSRVALRSMRHLYIQTSSAFFRRRVWDTGQLRLDEDFKQAMDQELFVRLDAEGFRFAHVKVPLSCFRVHGEQLTAQHGREFAAQEFTAVATKFGYRARPWVGRAAHRVGKIRDGSYLREVRMRRFQGRHVRWFSDADAARLTERLVTLG